MLPGSLPDELPEFDPDESVLESLASFGLLGVPASELGGSFFPAPDDPFPDALDSPFGSEAPEASGSADADLFG